MNRVSCCLAVAVALAAVPIDAGAAEPKARWFKGNLHTHSFWSDGDDFPEMIVAWYVEHGYDFLALSDHNILSRGDKWVTVDKTARGKRVAEAARKYRDKYGPTWVEEKEGDDKTLVRLKPLGEFRTLFEKPGEFLLIEGEEITDHCKKQPVHLIAANLRELIPPTGGKTVYEVMQRNVDAVWAQRRSTNTPMLVHLAHPNYGWAVTAEDLAKVRGERFFEIHNGHPGVKNYGDDKHASTERMWDIILTRRLVKTDGEIMYAMATDDAHEYHGWGVGTANPGRGWVMVRARHLTPESIIKALERGDFYASTGVRLRNIKSSNKSLSLQIEPETGVFYKTQFIGTELDHDPKSEPVMGKDGKPIHATRRYSKDIGKVLAEVDGLSPSYKFKGSEIYVRATVTSTRKHPNPFAKGDAEKAWVQPVRPTR